MAITRTAGGSSSDENPQHNDDPGSSMSDYERLRLEKIKRNEERMKELGLFRTKDALAASSAKKKKPKKTATKISPQVPQRRSSRKRKTVLDYSEEQVIPMYKDDEEKAKEEEETDSSSSGDEGASMDEDDEYEASESENDEDDNEQEEQPPKKRSRPSKPSTDSSREPGNKKEAAVAAAIENTSSFSCVNPKGGLTLEYAKTGRSSCRKCRDKIDKGKPRVGMEAWIVGRNCITWQHPSCLLQNMCCLYEKSNGGKGKCKVSHLPFAKGQLKIGIRCHTATSYYRIEAIEGVLANVVSLLRTEDGKEDFKLEIDGIDGNEKLSGDDRRKLESILETVFAQKNETRAAAAATTTTTTRNASRIPQETTGSEPKEEEEDSKVVLVTAKGKNKDQQPKLGQKSGAKGKVEWKFGGRTCYGTLIPRMETKTHCYARTHKGNVKTLAKGKDYWSMVAAEHY